MKYKDLTDKYFLRSKEILEKEKINPEVKYQVFCRKTTEMPDIEDAIHFLLKKSGHDIDFKYKQEGKPTKSGEVFLEYTSHVQDVIDLETVLLGLLSSSFTGELVDEDFKEIEKNAAAVVHEAKDIPVYYFGARHYDPKHDSEIAKITKEVGFTGTSTDNGAKHFNSKGIGTIPHAEILAVYADIIERSDFASNPTVRATQLFDEHMPREVPRIALIDTFNREISDSVEVATRIRNLSGIRVDTCGENKAQRLIPCIEDGKYIRGKGVTIESVWNLRRILPNTIDITVSSGFNAEKTKAFMEFSNKYKEQNGIPLFNSIGTGSLLPRAVMTTSDIVSYNSRVYDCWIPLSKVGRNERACNW